MFRACFAIASRSIDTAALAEPHGGPIDRRHTNRVPPDLVKEPAPTGAPRAAITIANPVLVQTDAAGAARGQVTKALDKTS